MNHTKGPWTVSDVMSDDVTDIILDYELEGEGSPVPIGFAYSPDDDHPDCPPKCIKESHANAVLMASAPDLLEALRKFVAWHDMDHETMTGVDVQTAYDQAIDAAKSALKKAV